VDVDPSASIKKLNEKGDVVSKAIVAPASAALAEALDHRSRARSRQHASLLRPPLPTTIPADVKDQSLLQACRGGNGSRPGRLPPRLVIDHAISPLRGAFLDLAVPTSRSAAGIKAVSHRTISTSTRMALCSRSPAIVAALVSLPSDDRLRVDRPRHVGGRGFPADHSTFTGGSKLLDACLLARI